jgi:hypothetical protein
MAKRKKKKATAEEQEEAMITQIVSLLCCPREATLHLGELCAALIEELGGPYSYARLAAATWGTTEGPPNEVEVLARDVMAEIDRHGRALEALLDRMDAVIDRGEDHADLDPDDVVKRIDPIIREQLDEVDEAR